MLFKFFFTEEKGAKHGKNSNHTATSYHRYDRNHGILITQGIEIHKVCCTKKDGYTDDSQSQRNGVLSFLLGYHSNRIMGHMINHLIDVVHDCTPIGGSCFRDTWSYNPLTAPVTAAITIKGNPFIVLEVDTLFLTGTGLT